MTPTEVEEIYPLYEKYMVDLGLPTFYTKEEFPAWCERTSAATREQLIAKWRRGYKQVMEDHNRELDEKWHEIVAGIGPPQ